jgi:hypothetical protein
LAVLRQIADAFTEGAESPDVMEARAVLNQARAGGN